MQRKYRPITWAILACLFVTGTFAIDPGSIDEEVALTFGKPQARKELEMRCVRTLKSDAAQEEIERACRILQAIGTTDAIDALAALLPDKKLSHFARNVLEPMSYPEAGKALRDAIGKSSGTTKVGIIHSLGVRRDAKGVEVLIPLLKDRDAQVAGAAVWSIGRTATEQAVRALGEFRGLAAGELKAVAADASLIVAEELLNRGKGQDAAKIYEELQAAKWARHVRMGAFVGLLAAQPDQAAQRLVKAFQGDDPALRGIAIDKVATLKAYGVGERFAAQLPNLPAETQVVLIGALTRRGEPSVRFAIARAAWSADGRVRVAALKALGELGDVSSVKLLCTAVASGKSDEEKKTAAASLRRITGKGIDGEIVQSMKLAEPDARAQMIGILRDRQATSTVSALLKEASGDNQVVRKAAFKALADLAEPEDLPVLVKLLVQLKVDELRGDAERAVAWVSRRTADEASRADDVLAALRSAKGTATKCSLLRVLQGIGNSEAFEAVREAAADKKAAVQDAAVRALADWPDERAIDALLEAYRTTKNSTLRVVALRGCVRLLGLGSRPAADTVKACGELLSGARRPEEKKLILACLANVADPAALKMVEPLLADNQVKAEAEVAMLGVAKAIAGSAPEQAKAAANTLIEKSKNENIRKDAAAIVKLIEKSGDYVTAWQVSGPYRKRGLDFGVLFDSVFPPEEAGAKGASWRVLVPDGKSARPWMFNLGKALGGENRVAYVRTWVRSEKEQPGRVEFGTDDGNKLWVNGKLVHANEAGGAATPGEYKVNVSLREGCNTLLLKITQDTGPWEFCLAIRKPDGEMLEGLKVQASPPAK